jgi:nucleoid DNA-binding protein
MTKQKIVEDMAQLANLINTNEAWEIVNNTNSKMLKKDMMKNLNTLVEMRLKQRGKI